MRKFLFATAITLILGFIYSDITFAACGGGPTEFTCNTADPNPDPNGIQEAANNANLQIDVLPGAGIDTSAASTVAIDTGNGNNRITLNEAEVTALDDNGIDSRDGNDTIEVTDSTVRCDDDCIDTRNGNDTITVIRSIIASVDNNGIDATGGNNKVTVIDSEVIGGPGTGNNYGINLSDGDDMLTIRNSLVFGENTGGGISRAILLKNGNDILRLETNARVDGFIDCGDTSNSDEPSGTIIFAMDVPEEAHAFISSEIAAAGLPDGSITINGLFYEWEDCEFLVSELNGVRSVRPIPTLSQWGFIAMAGVLGIVGFIAIQRRKAAA